MSDWRRHITFHYEIDSSVLEEAERTWEEVFAYTRAKHVEATVIETKLNEPKRSSNGGRKRSRSKVEKLSTLRIVQD